MKNERLSWINKNAMGQHCFDLVIVTTLTTGPYREFISAVKSQLAVEDGDGVRARYVISIIGSKL